MLSGPNERIEELHPAVAPSSPSTWLYATSIFLSAFLLFQVQPILAKLILPWFGGAAAVWTISLSFYQLTYLLGNLYAHFLIQHGGLRVSARFHATVLFASLFLLPIVPSSFWQPHGAEDPVWRILGLLFVTIGLPFLLLSATSPLLQSWHTRNRHGARPYRFYALSNTGSLLALLSYPVAVEPLLATRRQAWIWSLSYGCFAVLCAALAFCQPAGKPLKVESPQKDRPNWKLQSLWLALAATASALLTSITYYISQNIAAVPLLWIVPLSLYLLSLVLCFEGHRWYHRPLFLRLLPIALGGMAYALSPEFENAGPQLQIPLFCAGLFICCVACHGEMADLKPRPEFLSHFYLMVSAGGALGGIFVALVAPRLFRGFYELPIALGMCGLFLTIALFNQLRSSPENLGRPALFGLSGLTAILLVFLFHVVQLQSRQALVTVRNFYGVLRVNDVPSDGVRPAVRQLRNGTILHGAQIQDVARREAPTTYFGPKSGAGLALLAARQRGSIRVGIIGLGVGTLAAYGQKGDHYSIYEINPLVIDLANTQFDFVRRSQAQIEIISGDARLSLQKQPPQQFDVFLVDAFSGDAIPVHLLTREALDLYFHHLKPQGVLAIHVSNRFLDLPPVVEAGARAVGARVVKITSEEDPPDAIFRATWMLLDRPAQPGSSDLSNFLPPGAASQEQEKTVRVWTDDYSNLLQILK